MPRAAKSSPPAHLAMVEYIRNQRDDRLGCDPITTARMCAEVYEQIKNEDWSLVGTTI